MSTVVFAQFMARQPGCLFVAATRQIICKPSAQMQSVLILFKDLRISRNHLVGQSFKEKPVFRIRDQVPRWEKNPDPVRTTRIVLPRAKKPFFWLKYLNSFIRIHDPGWKKFGSRINIPGKTKRLIKRRVCSLIKM
jgi:hypothetical protein